MKILLDENIDVRFKYLFSNPAHEVFTVRDMQWNGVKNGELLQLLKNEGFDCWIVVDKNIPISKIFQNSHVLLLCLMFTEILLSIFHHYSLIFW